MNSVIKRDCCRLCMGRNIVEVLDLGVMPHAGNFLDKGEVGKEKRYPLSLYFCNDCSLLQILDVIPKEVLFKNYFYLSSVSNTLKKHFSDYAEELRRRFIKGKETVLEIGSNDGVLMSILKDLGIKCIGVEPANNIADIARSKGLDVVSSFFTESLAKELRTSMGRMKIITASNVFAHIDDMHDVMKGIKLLLEEDGLFIFEVQYAVDLIEKLEYDMVYHEHLCYYSLKSLMPFFEKFGMEIFDVRRTSMHAGSIRVYVKNMNGKELRTSTVDELLKIETEMKLESIETYVDFAEKVRKHGKDLYEMLANLKSKGFKIVGYGASGRANTLLNFCRIGTEYIDYIVDESPLRQNRFTPGTHIQIVDPAKFRSDNVDYVVLFAWSYFDEIMKKECEFLKKGGKFIVVLPQVKIYP
ncbi:MAG: class I SAM-dependent methyltransferase [Candidatus Aenigmarchaeota archaeon]|nr:class I SAM-dependent methyltransferase [Candidatus Aenigmarchaeota archaeon]